MYVGARVIDTKDNEVGTVIGSHNETPIPALLQFTVEMDKSGIRILTASRLRMAPAEA